MKNTINRWAMRDIIGRFFVFLWNVTHPFSLYKKKWVEVKPTKYFEK